jgi:hypothetical protein
MPTFARTKAAELCEAARRAADLRSPDTPLQLALHIQSSCQGAILHSGDQWGFWIIGHEGIGYPVVFILHPDGHREVHCLLWRLLKQADTLFLLSSESGPYCARFIASAPPAPQPTVVSPTPALEAIYGELHSFCQAGGRPLAEINQMCAELGLGPVAIGRAKGAHRRRAQLLRGPKRYIWLNMLLNAVSRVVRPHVWRNPFAQASRWSPAAEDDSWPGEKRFDLFLSYKSEDAALARRLCEHLTASGWRVWFAEYAVLLKDRTTFQEAVAAGIRHSRLGLCLTNPRYALSPHCRWELELLLHPDHGGPARLLEIKVPGDPSLYAQFPGLGRARSLQFRNDLGEVFRFIEQSPA